ncbi:helix-turn-helix domain-containing protein, partial [Pyxidicoccus sp. 3LFB2]
MSDPPGRQVQVEGTFIPRRPLPPGGGNGGTSRSRNQSPEGRGGGRAMDFLEMMHADAMRDAAGLLARRGYDNAQAAEVARAMRMSVGSLYRHYGSKLGLALAVRD